MKEIRNVTEGRPVVETTDQIGEIAGRLDGELGREDDRVSRSDAAIGTTASVFDEPVVTDNIGDFERLDVEVGTY